MYNGGKTPSLVNSAGKTAQLHAKESIWIAFSHHTRVHSKWIRDLKVRPEALRFLEGNIGSKIFDIGLGKNIFWIYLLRQENKSKNKQIGLHQTKKPFPQQRKLLTKQKGHLLHGRRYLQMIHLIKG